VETASGGNRRRISELHQKSRAISRLENPLISNSTPEPIRHHGAACAAAGRSAES
jgi:hypothetical protein